MNSDTEKLDASIRTLFKEIFSASEGRVLINKLTKPLGYTSSGYFSIYFLTPLINNEILVRISDGTRYQINPHIKYLLIIKSLENESLMFDLTHGEYFITWGEIKKIYDSVTQPIREKNQHEETVKLLTFLVSFEQNGTLVAMSFLDELMGVRYMLIHSLLKEKYITYQEIGEDAFVSITDIGKTFLNQELLNESITNQSIDPAAFLTAQQQTLQSLTPHEQKFYQALQKNNHPTDPFEAPSDPFNISKTKF